MVSALLVCVFSLLFLLLLCMVCDFVCAFVSNACVARKDQSLQCGVGGTAGKLAEGGMLDGGSVG